MQHPKILSLAMALPLLGSILVGCQKTEIHKHGFFSQGTRDVQRMPASVGQGYSAFQDPKQIFIYCAVNDSDSKSCYDRNLEESLNAYTVENGLPKDSADKLKSALTFEAAKNQTEKSLRQVFMAIHPSINKLVKKRVDFCKANANVYLDRCLKQYLKKETFQVLNAFQEGNGSINGHEYLFLKNRIEAKLSDKLDLALAHLRDSEKKKL